MIRPESFILKAFLASSLLALVILVLANGLIQIFRYGAPLPTSVLLILAALSFVLAASFFERYEVGSIIWSMLVALVGTAMLALLSGGVLHLLTMNSLSWEDLISSFAVAMIVSMSLLHYLKRSLGEIEQY
ncbi:MAG: hypothetical protein GKC10_09420 [Methanosarcinales archaeon]|nr:hypothetical protein [Methanosarcinales archaeon]